MWKEECHTYSNFELLNATRVELYLENVEWKEMSLDISIVKELFYRNVEKIKFKKNERVRFNFIKTIHEFLCKGPSRERWV